MTETNLTDLVRQFRETTGLSVEKLAHRAGLHSRTVSAVANAKPGQRFEDDTERKLREAMTTYLQEYVLDASALLGDLGDPELEDAVARVTARRRKRRS